MSVSRVCYATREDVQRAPDFKETAAFGARIDRAIQSASDLIEGHLHRTFYPIDTTYKWDWPNWQYAVPWRLWLDQWDLISLTQLESPHGTIIPLASVILYPPNRRPGWPYTRLELDRSTTAAFAPGPSPQLSIWVTGTFGFTADTDPAGTLAAALTDTTGTAVSCSDGSLVGVGDLIYAGTERMLVCDRAMADTTVTFGGWQSASDADNVGSVPDGTQFHIGEVIRVDTERMLVTAITGNDLTVIRGWDGTVLAGHTGGTIWAARSLTVARGQYGSTAATHLINAPLSRHRPPALIRDLAIAEGVNRVLQETSGYARTVGEADMMQAAPGVALADLWGEAVTVFGRKARIRAV